MIGPAQSEVLTKQRLSILLTQGAGVYVDPSKASLIRLRFGKTNETPERTQKIPPSGNCSGWLKHQQHRQKEEEAAAEEAVFGLGGWAARW